MLIFKTIEYKNLLSVGNIPVKLELNNKETNLIIGKNGTAKSSVLDALSFGLYGVAHRNINKPNLINSINKNNLLVEIEFETNSMTYKIRRGMKPEIFEIFQDGVLIKQPDRILDYQTYLEQNILKMNYRAFTQIVILGSSNYVPFLSLKPAPRREIVEDLLHLKIFTSMNVILKEQIQETKQRLSELNNTIDLSESKIRFINENLTKILKNSEGLLNAKQEQIDDCMNKYKINLTLHNTLKDEVETSETEYYTNIGLLDAKKEKIMDLRHKVKERVRTANNDVNFFEHTSNCPTCSQEIVESHKDKIISEKTELLNDLNSAYDQLSTKLDKIKTLLDEQNLIKRDISDKKNQMNECKLVCKHMVDNIKKLKEEIKTLKEQHEETTSDADQITSIQAELDKAIKEREEVLEETRYQRIGIQILKDNGIKAQLIKQYIPIINKYINKYLAELDFFVDFEINEQFVETIKSRFRDTFSFENFSQGEKFRIDLAILLTLRSVAKIRNSAVTNLLFLDEIFDGSLDEAGIEDFMKIVDILVKEGETIFVISHRQDSLIDKFQNAYEFTKNGNFTMVNKK